MKKKLNLRRETVTLLGREQGSVMGGAVGNSDLCARTLGAGACISAPVPCVTVSVKVLECPMSEVCHETEGCLISNGYVCRETDPCKTNGCIESVVLCIMTDNH